MIPNSANLFSASESAPQKESVARAAGSGEAIDGMVRTRLRVAVVTPIPTPYRDPFWSVFAGIPGTELTVYYCAAGKPDRPWTDGWQQDYDSEFLPGRNLLSWRGADRSCYWNSGITRRLSEGRFDALIVAGYNHITLLAAILWAVKTRTPFFLMCESHLRSPRVGWQQRLKRPFLEWIVRNSAGVLPTGQLASEYMANFGAPREKMTRFPNTPDLARLESEISRLRQNQASPVPPQLAGRPLILFVGRLIPKKRAELVIRAFHGIQAETQAGLVIVGDGPLRAKLEELVRELGLTERVHFAGFLQPDQVFGWYAVACVLVLPSSETWGVVVIEALAAGVPVIVSNEVGCYPDVVDDPALGTVVPARSETALRDALRGQLKASVTAEDFQTAWNKTRFRLGYYEVALAMHDAVARSVAAAAELRSGRK